MMEINKVLLEGALRIKVNISRRSDRERLKSIMVTSTNHGEGTTTLAVNLALAFALGGNSKVLLVEANIRRPSLDKLFGLEQGKGFVDFLSGKTDLAGSIRESPFPNIKVVTAGQISGETPATVFQAICQDTKDSIGRDFEWVLYDAAPVNAYPDTLMAATLSDGVILVIKAEKTREAAVKNAIESLGTVRANILGGVLNGRRYLIPRFIYKWL